MLPRPAALFFVITAGIGTAALAMAAPQTVNTALPVAEGEFVFREQFVYRQATDDPSAADRNLRVIGSLSVLGYGAAGNFAIFGVLPFVDKELDLNTPGGRFSRESSGIADIRLFARYTLYRDDAPGRTFRVAPFLGVEMPTGNDDERDSLGRLPRPLQAGSGSWDTFAGVVATWQTLDYQIDAQISYKLNSEADNFEFGHEASLDASLQYRVWPRNLAAGVPGFFYAVVEGNLVHAGKNRLNGMKDDNSGGTSFFIAPGIQYVTKRWIVEGIVQLPVSSDLNGASLKDDFTVRAGFRFNF